MFTNLQILLVQIFFPDLNENVFVSRQNPVLQLAEVLVYKMEKRLHCYKSAPDFVSYGLQKLWEYI